MSNLTEISNLFNEYILKKDVLDNHTDLITQELKEWCLRESERITDEIKNIDKFVSRNRKDIFPHLSSNVYCRTTLTGFGLDVCTKEDDADYCAVSVTSDRKYNCCIGTTWTKLPKPSRNIFRTDKNGKNDYCYEDTTLAYWTDVKRYLAIRNEELKYETKCLKDLVDTLILQQNERFSEMTKNHNDITRDDSTTITITIRKGV